MKIVANDLINDINASAPEERDIHELIKKALVPQGVEIPKPDTVFSINGISVFTKKSISTLIGKAKAGKTTVTSWMVANSIKENTKVLWVDTEQGSYYASRTQHWILKQAGMERSENLHFYDLKVYGPKERIEMIELIIAEIRPDLVIIDGIRDLVYDINSPEEATNKTGMLMRWAEEMDCHILVILHQNKGNDHARGHLGTEMINKSESVIKVEQNDDKLIVCSPEYTRSKPFEEFAFDRDQQGIPFVVVGYSGEVNFKSDRSKSRKKQLNPWDPAYDAVYPEMVDYCFSKKEYQTKVELKDMITAFMMKNGVKVTERERRGFMARLFEIGIIWENPYVKGYEKFGKNPKYIPKQTSFNPLQVKNIFNGESSVPKYKPDDEDPPF